MHGDWPWRADILVFRINIMISGSTARTLDLRSAEGRASSGSDGRTASGEEFVLSCYIDVLGQC